MTIYFVTTYFDREVHAQALGFTWHYYWHAVGETPEEATERVREHCRETYKLGVVRSNAVVAQQQNLTRYTFPEQIVGLRGYAERKLHQV